MNQNEIVAALSAAIGAEQVLHDDTSRAHFSHDLFHSGLPPACVVVPRTPEDVVDAVRVATTAGHPVVPRGGGMSYTGGYVANDDKAVMFVEAGCTWAKLHEALAAKGLRTPYWGPLSGKKATIGGTLSQNSVFFGSVRHGSAAESVLSVDVVLADGTRMRTGSAGDVNGIPFVRWGGPDITGLFVGDVGAFGIKVAASLRLIKDSEAMGFGSYAFDDFETMLRMQVELAHAGHGAEAFGIDASQQPRPPSAC